MISRRAFLATSATAILAAPRGVLAQPARKVYRIAFLRAGQPPKTWIEAFRQGLRELGYVEGQNLVMEFPGADANMDDLPRLAKELVRSRVDIIVVPGAQPALVAKATTTAVPIVFTIVYDPVELGLIESLDVPHSTQIGVGSGSQ